MRIAIIDCGTNTFNLLIAEKMEDQLQFIFEDKIPVKIGKGGIESRTIVQDAYQRALEAMDRYAASIKQYNVDKVIATSTSAFSSTDNGPVLKQEIFERTGIDVQIISGAAEADYIYRGVTWAYPPVSSHIYLIMDIGGGSTEFILYGADKIYFKESYLLGASRLLEKFKPNDPLSVENINMLEGYFKEVMNDTLIAACQLHPPEILVGSSGFFDTLRKICFYEFQWKNSTGLSDINMPITVNEFNHWYKKMLPMNLEQRINIEGMTSFRAEMMGISMLLVDYIIKECGIGSIINTTYALKEGVLREAIGQ
jgi:exopolyphosphatase / guanosine-5'-triphosphate,3'-diphosphate pyrophosphatase